MSGDAPLAPAATVRRKGDWLTAKVGDELVMMNAANGQHIGLTETGARIWELIETPQSFAALCGVLAEEFDAPEDLIAGDAGAFLRRLAEKGAVELA
jgi:hypothetical protein